MHESLQEHAFLEEHKKARAQENVIPLTTDTGEPILDETEFSALTRLKEVSIQQQPESMLA